LLSDGGQFRWNDYHYLEGLPMDRLLQLQRTVGELRASFLNASDPGEPPAMETRELPEDTAGKGSREWANNMFALPLKMENIAERRSGVEPWNSKPSKVQTIFQISITGLAFLAFAGYLLCMIVQAIKSKGTTYYHPTISGTATLSSTIKKRRPFKRRKRQTLPYVTADNAGAPLDAYDADQLHRMLIAFAEAYVEPPGRS
uniref:Uncharacterized protein n=1 Tax=Anopheles atroparvus TaxID=41427 RepID=A0A182IP27_ANOAO